MDTIKLNVFLCHSSLDKPAARELYNRLNSEGWIDIWFDEIKLLPGQDWEYEIERALNEANVVIVLLSSNSISTEGYVHRELRFSLDIALEKPEGMIYMLPVRLEDCIPPRKLRNYHYVNYFGNNKEKSYQNIIRSLKIKLDVKKKKHENEKLDNYGAEKELRAKKDFSSGIQILPQVGIFNEKDITTSLILRKLRSPISSIDSYVNLLLSDSLSESGESHKIIVGRIKKTVSQAISLIDQFIDGVSDNSIELDIRDVIANASSQVNELILEKNIAIHLDLSHSLPALVINVDALEQILTLLIGNAISVSPIGGSVTVKARKLVEKRKEYLLIQVIDTGWGIASDDLLKVFSRKHHSHDAFIQNISTVGTELSIAKALAEDQNFQIWMDTEMGVGSVFNLLLPANNIKS